MSRILGFAYGAVSYLVFLGVFVYLIGFVGDILVPKSIDSGPATSLPMAVGIDMALLALFAVQHSVMARQGFKRWWTRVVPRHLERSTYVLAASVVLAVVMWGWQPISGVVWSVESPVGAATLQGVFWAGWGMVLLSTFLIDHFRLFGLRQVWMHLRGQELVSPKFETPSLYKVVRHPLYLGFLLAFWATPRMTVGHLLFAAVWTSWILLAIKLEEGDLVRFHGEAYREYRRRVPMLIPRPMPGRRPAGGASAASRESGASGESAARGAGATGASGA